MQGYVDQSAQQLQLSLVEGNLDEAQFTIVQREHFKFRDDIAVHAMIIGASHVITIAHGDYRLHEVFACVSPVVRSKLLHFGTLAQVQGEFALTLPHGIRYEFSASLNQLSQHREAIDRRLRADGMHSGERVINLIAEFPPRSGESSARTAVSVARQRHDTLALSIATIHEYPNEDAAVFTETRIRFEENS